MLFFLLFLCLKNFILAIEAETTFRKKTEIHVQSITRKANYIEIFLPIIHLCINILEIFLKPSSHLF